jgi:hypothetical protein
MLTLVRLKNKTMRRIVYLLSFVLLIGAQVFAQSVPNPKSHFGFNIGDNYKLATFTATEACLLYTSDAADEC